MNSKWFDVSEDGATILTEDGKREVRMVLNTVPVDRFGAQFGATKPAFYKWLQGNALSARGRIAVEKLLETSNASRSRSLEECSIEEIVAELRRRGIKDVNLAF